MVSTFLRCWHSLQQCSAVCCMARICFNRLVTPAGPIFDFHSVCDPAMVHVDCLCMQVVSLLSLTLLEVHLARRMLETAYIMQYPEDAKMHLIAYVFGLRYVASQWYPALQVGRHAKAHDMCSVSAATMLFYHCHAYQLLPLQSGQHMLTETVQLTGRQWLFNHSTSWSVAAICKKSTALLLSVKGMFYCCCFSSMLLLCSW